MGYNKRQHLQDNIAAIRAFWEWQDRMGTSAPPSDELKNIAQKYTGFGGIKCVLFPAEKDSDIELWPSDRELFPLVRELYALLQSHCPDPQEYERIKSGLRSSVLTAFFTPPQIVNAIRDCLEITGIMPSRFLDPSAGIGQFASSFTATSSPLEVVCFEKDILSGSILSVLHPNHSNFIEGFENIDKSYTNYFDVAASNIPFGKMSVFDPSFLSGEIVGNVRRESLKTVHNYFFIKGLDTLREGGLLAYITSQ